MKIFTQIINIETIISLLQPSAMMLKYRLVKFTTCFLALVINMTHQKTLIKDLNLITS